MTDIVRLVLGLILLAAGRRLYWLFVGIVGFFLGMNLAGMFFKTESELVYLAIGLVAGVIGAVLALFLQQLAVGLAGFIAGGYIFLRLIEIFGWAANAEAMPANWILYLIGGFIGVILIVLLFDWALIILSSLAGAGLVLQAFELIPWLEIFLFIFLVAFGIGFQRKQVR